MLFFFVDVIECRRILDVVGDGASCYRVANAFAAPERILAAPLVEGIGASVNVVAHPAEVDGGHSVVVVARGHDS